MAENDETILDGGTKTGTEGNPGSDWREALGDYKDEPSFKDYKDLGSVLKTYKNQESMLGKRVEIPGDDAPEDKVKEFYGKLAPKDVADYGIDTSDEKTKELLETLRENGVSKRQAKALTEKIAAIGAAEGEASKAASAAARQASIDKLKEIYGGESQVKEALGDAAKFLDEAIVSKYPEFMDFLRNTKISEGGVEVALANHPVLAHAFKVMSDAIGDDEKVLDGETGSKESGDLMSRWTAKLSEMSASTADKSSPEYQKLQREIAAIEKEMDSGLDK